MNFWILNTRLYNGGPVCNNYYMDARGEQPLTDALRRAILESGLSFKGLADKTGVLRQSLMKFARGEQSLRLDMADKLAVFFGLALMPQDQHRRSKG
jgi:hypothetical protein